MTHIENLAHTKHRSISVPAKLRAPRIYNTHSERVQHKISASCCKLPVVTQSSTTSYQNNMITNSSMFHFYSPAYVNQTNDQSPANHNNDANLHCNDNKTVALTPRNRQSKILVHMQNTVAIHIG